MQSISCLQCSCLVPDDPSLLPCPQTLAQASADRGRFMAEEYVNLNAGLYCGVDPSLASHCFRTSTPRSPQCFAYQYFDTCRFIDLTTRLSGKQCEQRRWQSTRIAFHVSSYVINEIRMLNTELNVLGNIMYIFKNHYKM